ncbi:MAG: aldo/keto reductase [Christensenellaceae bacterium]
MMPVIREFTESEARMGMIDIFMLHWPAAEFRTRWQALEDLYLAGRVRRSVFPILKRHRLEELMEHARVKPMIDQIEAHAYFMDYDTIDFCKAEGICVQAWRPLMRTGHMLENPEIAELGHTHGQNGGAGLPEVSVAVRPLHRAEVGQAGAHAREHRPV